MILAALFVLLSNWLMFELADRIMSPGDEPADDQRKTPFVCVYLVIVAILILNLIITMVRQSA